MRPAAIITITLLAAAAVWLESAAIITHAPFDFDDCDVIKPWPRPVPTTWPTSPDHVMTCETRGLSADWYSGHGPEPQDYLVNPTLYRLIQIRTGWPIRTFTHELTLDFPDARGTIGWLTDDPTSLWTGGLEIPAWVPKPDESPLEAPCLRRFPLKPLWPAFLFMTAAHATLFTALAQLPALARRHYRSAKKQCPSCGYTREGLSSATSTCPECGQSLDRK